MISFRYHVVSLVAVLLALGAGVALGSGPLQRDDDPATTSTTGTAGQPRPELDAQSRFNNAFAASLQASLASGRLEGRTVTLVVLPGAPAQLVSALTQAVGQASGSVTGTVRVGADLVDPAKRQLVDELGGQLEAGTPKVVLPAGTGTYERIGSLLAFALATTAPGGDAVDQQGQGVLAGLSTGGLISIDGELQQRGNLLLVAAGAPEGSTTGDRGSGEIVLSLAKSLDATSGGAVVAGPVAASDDAGALAAVRLDGVAAKAVSTVDSADVPAGVIVTVLALAEQAAGGSGHYGIGPGVTGLRPGVPPAG